jgi:hypothetical protein
MFRSLLLLNFFKDGKLLASRVRLKRVKLRRKKRLQERIKKIDLAKI